MIPQVNLGQSQFQDTFFVAGAQLTPFRQLRQIELQVKELENSLKKADINKRRTKLRIAGLNPVDPLEALDIEELEYDLGQQEQLITDAKVRLANFLLMREQLLERTPKEYWDQGFEQAEVEYWTFRLAKQLAIAKTTGVPDTHLIEQMMLLPMEMQNNIVQLTNEANPALLTGETK